MALFSKKPKISPRRLRAESNLELQEMRSSAFRRGSTLQKISFSDDGLTESERSKAQAVVILRRRILVAIGAAAVLAILILIFFSQLTTKVLIGVTSDGMIKTVDQSVYQTSINQYLDQHPIERLKFVASSVNIANFVRSQHPEVADVEPVGELRLSATKYDITFRRPVAGWQIGAKQYYVDDQGVAFEQNYFAAPTLQIVDQSNTTLNAGQTVASSRFLSFVGKVVAEAKKQGLTVVQATLPLGTAREVDIRLNGVSYYFKLSVDRGAAVQIEDLVRVEKYLVGKGIVPSYVDLRVEGRAFYK